LDDTGFLITFAPDLITLTIEKCEKDFAQCHDDLGHDVRYNKCQRSRP
jgi:hypothetical protein